jgi:hypothetical protein
MKDTKIKSMQQADECAHVSEIIETVLSEIIDDWYERVEPHYVTENLKNTKQAAELKRFHDEKGHRIKFNKDELDFTYGLKSHCKNEHYIIEISVNNKVMNFDYQDFGRRLALHYQQMGNQLVPTPYALKKKAYCTIFQFQPNLDKAFRVEKHPSKTDIMRLSFKVEDRFIRCLASHPVSGKQLIEDYCVSPFRSLYATVYRKSSA